MLIKSRRPIRLIVLTLLAELLFFAPSPAEAVGTPTFTVPTSPIAVNEQTPTQIFPGLTFVDSGTNYSGKWIEYSVDTSTTNDRLLFETVTVADTTSAVISVVGSTIFKGNGSTADPIGTIDSTKNGLNGNNLKVTFENTFANGNFSNTTVTRVGDVVSLNGWTAYERRVYLGGVSTIEGYPTPIDTSFPSPTDNTTNKDSSSSPSQPFNVTPKSPDRNGSGAYLELSNQSASCSDRYCIIRGPYVVSNNPVFLQPGDSVTFWWQANTGGDYYDVYGYLLDTSTGTKIELLNDTGANQTWTQTTKIIGSGQGGSYKFVFIVGTWDASGGQYQGATLLLDDVNVSTATSGVISDTDLANLSRLLRYEVTNDAPDTNKTVRISTSTGAVDGVQTLTISPVNDPITLQTPNNITRVRSPFTDSATATGTLVSYDPDFGINTPITVTYGVTGGTSSGGSVTLVGQYGLLTINEASGAYSYEFYADTITALTQDAYETFTVTATDGVDTPTRDLVIRLVGTLPADGSTPRTLAFTAPSPLNITRGLGETFTVTAVPSHGVGDGTISYSIGSSTGCTISGTRVTITSLSGTCQISASITVGTYYTAASTTSSVVVTMASAVKKEPEIIPSPTFVTVPTLYATQGQNTSVFAVAVNANSYEVVGSLPAGLTINPKTGVISGIPTVFGTFSITIIARNDGGGTSATFPFIIAKAVKPAPNLDAIVPRADKQGNPYVTLNGNVIDATIRANSTSNGMEVIASGWTLALSAMQSDGKAAPLSPQSALLIKENQQVYVGGTGFKANSEVRVYLFSTPQLLGTTTTDAKGEFAAVFPMLKEVSEGDHLIQVNGISPDNDLRSATLPAIYEKIKPVVKPDTSTAISPEKPTTPVVTPASKNLILVVPFAFNKYSLGSSQISILKSLKKTKATEIKVVGYAQPSSPQPDIALSLDRAIEVKKSVSKIVPVAKFTTRGSGPKNNPLCAPYKNKCVVIYVKA